MMTQLKFEISPEQQNEFMDMVETFAVKQKLPPHAMALLMQHLSGKMIKELGMMNNEVEIIKPDMN
jgi:hypothetical protein